MVVHALPSGNSFLGNLMVKRESLKHLSVLFVEDEESLLALLTAALGQRFKHYDIAKDGKEGLEKFQSHRPDIIISDITMPRMDGLSMAKQIHRLSPDTPIVILSAYSDKEKLLGAIDAGITKYFIKPFDPDELLVYLCTLGGNLEAKQGVKLISPYRFDKENKKLFKAEHLVKLTVRELDIIAYLVDAPNHIISNEKMRKRIGKDGEASDESVRVFIRRLREKTDKAFVENLPRQGYVLGLG